MDNTQCTASSLTPEQIDDLVKKLGGHEVVLKVLRGEFSVSASVARAWREQDRVIRFSVTSKGRTGKEWIAYLKSGGFWVTPSTEFVLCSPDFKPTSGITTEIAVLKGSLFKEHIDRTTSKIRNRAKEHQFQTPSAEVACLIQEKFTDEEREAMDLPRIIVMHEPITGFNFMAHFLGMSARSLQVFPPSPDCSWRREDGFAFAVP